MRQVWACLLALVFLPGQICSQTGNDESKIIALENLWNQMQLHHDAGAMEKILDPDFVLTDYDGAVLSKSQFLASIRDVADQLTVEVSEDMKLHRHGDTVIVTGATHEKGTAKGKRRVFRAAGVNIQKQVDSVEKILQAEQRGQQDDAIANVRRCQLVDRRRFENEEPAA
jgi:ketosteroid isomerase-like protein